MNIQASVKNQAPGTVTYTGTYTDVPLTMVLYEYNAESWSKKPVMDLSAIGEEDTVKWLNITGLSHINAIKDLGDRFDIDPLILEDVVNVAQYSKIQSEPDLLFSVWKMIYKKKDTIEHEHVSILLIDNWVITFQENLGDVFDSVRNRLERNLGIIRKMRGDYLYFALIDAIIDHYSDTLSILTRRFDEYERQILDQESVAVESLYPLRKELSKIKGALFPMKNALLKLLASKQTLISDDARPYYQDAFDNLMQTSDQVMEIRELAASLHDQHLSELSNQMNIIMTTLTIFSAVFIPLSFLAGVFGMNFQQMPGLDAPHGFAWFFVGCAGVAAFMLVFFKKKKWF
jgi:magnesium transporter